MDFVNDSPFEAELVRSVLSPEDSEPRLAIVVLKVTYGIGDDGEATVADEQLAIRREIEETELGPVPDDAAVQKPGFDVLVLGTARSPEGRPVTEMRIDLRVGAESRGLVLFGDRRWVRDRGGLVASPPEPFEEMPLSYARAYGGKAKAMGYEVPYPYNPSGRGYVLEEKYADEVPLPNIEDPDALIASWEDQPLPAGFAPIPLGSMFTVERGIEFDPETREQRVKPEVFQNAHPKLVFSEVAPGTEIGLTGMGPAGDLSFRLPDLRASVAVELGGDSYRPEGRVDTLCILPDERRFFLVHRTPFKYRFVPEQIRVARLSVDTGGLRA
jgi:hypothetical protein